MSRWRRWAVDVLTRLLRRLEPEVLIYPPDAQDYSRRNFGRPEAQTAGYLGGDDTPPPHDDFGHIRLYDIKDLAKDRQADYDLPAPVKAAIGVGHDVLDAACGLGNDGACMLRLGNRVWGLDVIRRCVERSAERGLIAQRLDLNVERFPFETGRFDVVTSFDTIEHLYHWRHFVAECLRVLKPGGVFVCSTFNIAWGPYRRAWGEGRLGFGDNNIRHFSAYALRRWLQEDFKLEVQSVYPDDAPSILMICRRP